MESSKNHRFGISTCLPLSRHFGEFQFECLQTTRLRFQALSIKISLFTSSDSNSNQNSVFHTIDEDGEKVYKQMSKLQASSFKTSLLKSSCYKK